MFCGAQGRLTDEHTFGDWLRKLGYSGAGLREIGDPPIVQNAGPFSHKLKIVCANCNNGWMSRLEQDAKPLLVHLFRAHGRLIPIEEDAQITLARWAYKTAVVCAYSDKNQVDAFPEEHRREFYETDQPPRQTWVRIGMMTVPSDPLKGEHLAAYQFDSGVDTVTADEETSIDVPWYRTTIRLINVVFCVMGSVTDEIKMKEQPDKVFRTMTQPLWPVRRPTIWWPPIASQPLQF
ncbi:hypothetical protein KIPE111705_46905 [Kibdelosporangium persicum]|uniref:Uncharacterized protein n=1 Tax=Kibdelosporangium persicum TaxID=2698649 RepID=A0ABX2FGX0_9PSEU|nr:hypothetical protein [Kibdelosporangium persicum]